MLLSQNSEKAEAILPKVAGSMTSIEELVNRMNEMTEKVATIAANTDYFFFSIWERISSSRIFCFFADVLQIFTNLPFLLYDLGMFLLFFFNEHTQEADQ